MNWTVHHRQETSSTNLDARGAAPWTAFTADFQTAGRGRLDHRWHSASGVNLMMSAVVPVDGMPPEAAATFPLVVGLAVGGALSSLCPDGFAECAKNVALQTAAMTVAYLDKDSVPASVLEEEKSILIKQMQQDPKMANKPQQVLEKIVEGKLGKFYENNCLLEQAYVKDDSMSVAKYVAGVAKELGGSIKVTGYARYDKGEGLEKREEDFAAEIAKMVNG